MPRLRYPLTTLALSLAALTIAGCSAPAETAEPETTAAAPTPQASTAAPEETPDPVPTETVLTVTCNDLIMSDVTESLIAQGWAANESPLHIANTAIPGGILCTWGPADTIAGTDGQMYGYGVLSDALAQQAQGELKDQGWVAETTDEGTYLSAPVIAAQPPATDPTAAPSSSAAPSTAPSPSLTPMDGITYLFGEGWVKYADTREGLILIQAP